MRKLNKNIENKKKSPEKSFYFMKILNSNVKN